MGGRFRLGRPVGLRRFYCKIELLSAKAGFLFLEKQQIIEQIDEVSLRQSAFMIHGSFLICGQPFTAPAVIPASETAV